MSGKAYKVFIVDDDPSSRLVASFCFQRPEFELVQLESGEACLAALDQKPDIVLLDPMFPERQKSGSIKKKFQLLNYNSSLHLYLAIHGKTLDLAFLLNPYKVRLMY